MKQTAVEWLCNEWLYIDQEFDMKLIDKKTYWERLKSVQEQVKAMEKEQSHKYAEFAIRCDRKDMKILNFEDWIKLETKSE